MPRTFHAAFPFQAWLPGLACLALAATGTGNALAAPNTPIKSQVAEGLKLAAAAKVGIADYFANWGTVPYTRSDAGLTPNPSDTQGAYVTAVDINGGLISITYGNLANPAIAGQTLTLAPLRSADGHLSWQCGLAPMPAGLTPLNDTASTTLPNQYLPAPCGLYNKPPIKSQVDEGLFLAESAKVAIQEFFASNNVLPDNRAEAGLSPNPGDTAGNYVSSVDIASGKVIVTFGNLASTEIVGTTLSLTPTQWTNSGILWNCDGSTLPVQYLPSSCSPETAPLKKQIMEGLHLAANLKHRVGAYIAAHGEPPQDRAAAGLSANPNDTHGNFVAGVDIQGGAVLITFGNLANQKIAGQTLALNPYLSQDGHVSWQCGYGSMPGGLTPVGTPGSTSVETQYLPPECAADTGAAPLQKQIVEGLRLANSLKGGVGKYFARTHQAPGSRTETGLTANPGDTSGKYVSGVDISNGSIVIMFGNLARPELSGQSLALAPYQSADGHITWICGNAQIPPGLIPIGNTGWTSLGNELLPVQCRF